MLTSPSLSSDSTPLIDHQASHIVESSSVDPEKQYRTGSIVSSYIVTYLVQFFLPVWFLFISTLQYPTLLNLVKRLVLFLCALDTSGAHRENRVQKYFAEAKRRVLIEPFSRRFWLRVRDHDLKTPLWFDSTISNTGKQETRMQLPAAHNKQCTKISKTRQLCGFRAAVYAKYLSPLAWWHTFSSLSRTFSFFFLEQQLSRPHLLPFKHDERDSYHAALWASSSSKDNVGNEQTPVIFHTFKNNFRCWK